MASLGHKVQKHFKISDKEWDRMSIKQIANKTNKYMDDLRKDANAVADERRRNVRSDMIKNTYADRKLSNRKVRDTLNKAGYNIKQDTSAAQRFKKRYGK
tara:strand:+ start:519 stop:818 length:300 start_codon:yes stop_codon:yes gene_type:complete